jgi:peptidoglycan hydrolase CwlO-like protein
LSAVESPSAVRRTAGLIAVLVFAALVGVHPAIAADSKDELAKAKAELSRLLDRIEAQQATVDGLEADVAELSAQITAVEADIAEAQVEIARLQGEIEQAGQRLDGLQGQLDERARVAYQSGGPGTTLEFLLTSTSLADLSTRLEIMDRSAEQDHQLVQMVENQRAKLETKEAEQQRIRSKLQQQERELRIRQGELVAKLNSAKDLVAELNSNKAEAEKLVEKLKEKVAAEERARLAALQKTSGRGGGTVSGHPFQVCPVRGFVGYSDDFGAPRYGGGYHPHAGNDLFAALGTPIVAPFSGTAANASNGLGGLSVKVYGAAGWVYNAHLSAMGQLGPVSAGTVIGYVGNSGDAAGTPPHDHFEWHPYSPPGSPWTSPYGVSKVGDAIDPYPYLNQVC